MTDVTARRVAPFGHLGITACVPLPRAYRSLPRPSSPLCAQASPTCFRSLDPFLRQAEHARSTTRVKQFFTCYANCVTSEIQIPCGILRCTHAFVPRSHNHPLSISEPGRVALRPRGLAYLRIEFERKCRDVRLRERHSIGRAGPRRSTRAAPLRR